MDRYEVEAIAREAAERAAGDSRRELQYKLDDLQRDVDDLKRALDDERHQRKTADSTLDSMIMQATA